MGDCPHVHEQAFHVGLALLQNVEAPWDNTSSNVNYRILAATFGIQTLMHGLCQSNLKSQGRILELADNVWSIAKNLAEQSSEDYRSGFRKMLDCIVGRFHPDSEAFQQSSMTGKHILQQRDKWNRVWRCLQDLSKLSGVSPKTRLRP